MSTYLSRNGLGPWRNRSFIEQFAAEVIPCCRLPSALYSPTFILPMTRSRSKRNPFLPALTVMWGLLVTLLIRLFTKNPKSNILWINSSYSLYKWQLSTVKTLRRSLPPLSNNKYYLISHYKTSVISVYQQINRYSQLIAYIKTSLLTIAGERLRSNKHRHRSIYD